MLIRCAHESDLQAITDISNHYIANTIIHFATQPVTLDETAQDYQRTHKAHPWLVAVDANNAEEVLGFARSSLWKGRCAYDWAAEISVYVKPTAQRQGLARRLYQRLFAILFAQGYHTLIAGIALPNEPSVRLHEAMGMTHLGTFERVGYKMNQWIDVGYWQKQLVESDDQPGGVISVDEALARMKESG